MKPAEQRRLLANTGTAWNRITDLYRNGNLTRLWDAQPGLRAAATDGDGITASGRSDPTGNTAGETDATVTAMRLFEQHITDAYKHLDAAGIILAGYGKPREANEADRLALQRANTRPEPFCESCARVSEPHGDTPWLIPPWEGRGPTDVGMRLDDPMLLCRWCYTFVAGQGLLPSTAQLEARRDGKRVLVKDQTPRRTA